MEADPGVLVLVRVWDVLGVVVDFDWVMDRARATPALRLDRSLPHIG